MNEPQTEPQNPRWGVTTEEVFAYIKRSIRVRGLPPTNREIGEAVGLRSTCTVAYHVNKLVEQGRIKRIAGGPRSIQVIDPEACHACGRPFEPQP